MGFNSLENTNQKLATNPELSDHNKQVLEDFFGKARFGGAEGPHLSGLGISLTLLKGEPDEKSTYGDPRFFVTLQ